MRNPFPGQIEGMVRFPRLGKRAGGKGGGAGHLVVDTPAGGLMAISGYFDGMVLNPAINPPTIEPTWDGIFHWQAPSGNWKASDTSNFYKMQLNLICNIYLELNGTFQLEFYGAVAGGKIWIGDNGSASSPLGVYNYTEGTDLGPATLTITTAPGVPGATSDSLPCKPA